MIKNNSENIKSRSDKYKKSKKHSKDLKKKYKNKKSVYSKNHSNNISSENSDIKLNKEPDELFNRTNNKLSKIKLKKTIIIVGISAVCVFSVFGIYKYLKNKFNTLEKYTNPVIVEDQIIEVPGLKTIKEVNVIDTESSLDFIKKPVFLESEPEVEYDNVVLEDLEAENAPSLYTKVILNGNDFGMFIFTDGNGEYQYRCYASKQGQKENDTAKYYGFVDVEFEPQDNGEFKIMPVSNEFVDTANDTFGQIEPMTVEEEDLPEIYNYADGNLDHNLFYFIDKSGNRNYRVYGGFEGKTAHYYPADENTGQMIPGSLYVDISTDEQNAATYEELQELGIEVSPQEELEKRERNNRNNED